MRQGSNSEENTLLPPETSVSAVDERRADRIVHLAGLGAAAIGTPMLIILTARWHGISGVTLATGVYAVCLVAMLGLSAAYHMNDEPGLRTWLRRGDHAAIFAKIAGTFTPFVVLHGDAGSLPILGALWGGAAAGIALKLVQPPDWDRLAVALYLALAWGAVLLIRPLLLTLSPPALTLVVLGGTLYSIGVIFYLWEQLPYQNAIWHAFVLVATVLCFLAVLAETGHGPTLDYDANTLSQAVATGEF